MVNNRFFNIKIILSFSLLFIMVSCRNLPGKNIPTAKISDDSIIAETADFNQNEPDSTDIIQRFSPQDWNEPVIDGPTVTPIVLDIEKKGETAPLIIRETYNSDNTIMVYDVKNSDIVTVINTPVPTAIAYSQSGMFDGMEVYSYNPRNGSVVLPGQSLHLDVSLQNKGSTTWQTNYKVIDTSASPMAVQKEYNLPYAVAPGGTVLLSIYLAAPSPLGNYTETFEIRDSYGTSFGEFSYNLTVGDFSVVTSIPTLTATITPTYYSPAGITATPDSLAWMCIDPERSKLQDCYSFCVEYSHRPEFRYCYYNGELYLTPVP